MPFPNVFLLDDFNRANENPLSDGGKWSGPIIVGNGQCILVSNHATYSGGGASDSYWNNQTGFDWDVSCSGVTLSGSARIGFRACITAPNTGTASPFVTSTSYYQVVYFESNLSMDISAVVDGVEVAFSTQNLPGGGPNALAMTVRGTRVEAWARVSPSPVLTLNSSLVCPAIPGPGFAGITIDGPHTMDNFSARTFDQAMPVQANSYTEGLR